MKYLLGIGFAVTQKYKKDPIVRVSIDNRFVDEFTVSDYPEHDKEWMQDLDPWVYKAPFTDWMNHAKPWEKLSIKMWGTFPKKFNLYVIDEAHLKHKKQLVIDIANSDSNYTNGFMTKSTLLDFRAFLLPLKYLKFFYHEGYKVRKDFNEDIIDDAFDSDRYFDPEGIEDNNFKIANEKRYYMVQGVVSNGVLGKNMFAKKIEGYPFAHDIFWNGKPLDTWQFGGSGKLTMNLLTKKSGTVLFDPKDAEILKLQNEKIVAQRPGFYISQKFFSMVHQNMFDKYLYNENL
tara:strand:- start:754 stop:1620 length:867 start_codon:yes stop_codon:yes gene_type:complete